MKRLIFIITISFILFSCENETLEIELNLVFDHSLKEGKYPEYFKVLTLPFSSNDCSKNYLLKPINIGRLDISKKLVETNAWHFENRGDELTVDYVTNWLTQYYSDSLMIKNLTLPTGKSINENTINSYINKKKSKYDIFIFSEESELDEFNGISVLHTPKDVNQKIQEKSCNSKNNKVIILVNPIFLDEITDNSDTITQLLEEADILFNKKDYETAQLKYQEVLNIDKDNSVALERINSIKKTVTTTTKTTTTIEVGKKPVKPKTKTSKTTYKITNDGSSWSKKQNEYHSDYGKYYGELKDGKMHGGGTLVFYKTHLIPVRKNSGYENVKAYKNYTLTGRFKDGYFVNGKLVDEKGQKKKSILPGE